MLPHPVLTERYATAEAKPPYVDQRFDKGARFNDGIVDWGFLGSGASYRRWVQKRHGLKKGDHLLDVACGTGPVPPEAVLAALLSVGFAEAKRFTSVGLFSEYVAQKA